MLEPLATKLLAGELKSGDKVEVNADGKWFGIQSKVKDRAGIPVGAVGNLSFFSAGTRLEMSDADRK